MAEAHGLMKRTERKETKGSYEMIYGGKSSNQTKENNSLNIGASHQKGRDLRPFPGGYGMGKHNIGKSRRDKNSTKTIDLVFCF